VQEMHPLYAAVHSFFYTLLHKGARSCNTLFCARTPCCMVAFGIVVGFGFVTGAACAITLVLNSYDAHYDWARSTGVAVFMVLMGLMLWLRQVTRYTHDQAYLPGVMYNVFWGVYFVETTAEALVWTLLVRMLQLHNGQRAADAFDLRTRLLILTMSLGAVAVIGMLGLAIAGSMDHTMWILRQSGMFLTVLVVTFQYCCFWAKLTCFFTPLTVIRCGEALGVMSLAAGALLTTLLSCGLTNFHEPTHCVLLDGLHVYMLVFLTTVVWFVIGARNGRCSMPGGEGCPSYIREQNKDYTDSWGGRQVTQPQLEMTL
jgi:hypothetical protein